LPTVTISNIHQQAISPTTLKHKKNYKKTLQPYYNNNKKKACKMNTTSLNQIPWWFTCFDEKEINAFANAVKAKKITQGSVCKKLENKISSYLDIQCAALTSSCSSAILCSLIAIGIKPFDEVIIPAHTFIAAANAVNILGAKVVLCKVKKDFPLIDPADAVDCITDKTKAIIAVNLNGRCADTDSIIKMIKKFKKKIYLIEDSAQSFGSRDSQNRFAGTRGDIGVFSMGITKLFSTGEGGFAVTNDIDIDCKIRKARNHGSIAIKKNKFHERGFNLRLTDLMASVGLAQFSKIKNKINKLNRIYEIYEKGISDLKSLNLLKSQIPLQIPLWIEVICQNRPKVISLLKKIKVQTKAFHPCLSESIHLFDKITIKRTYVNSHFFAEKGLILPSGPDQKKSDIKKIIEILKENDKNLL
jgi:dTDP-4-amino-4,6-dideoxygalactose transaminase